MLKDDSPAAQQRRFVGHGFARAILDSPGVTNEPRQRNLACQRFQFIHVAVQKCRPFQEILRWITAEAKLGKNGKVRPSLFGLFRQAQDASGIPCEVANGGIELRERYFHARTTVEYGWNPKIANSDVSRSDALTGKCPKHAYAVSSPPGWQFPARPTIRGRTRHTSPERRLSAHRFRKSKPDSVDL